jgi:hypothetical protein
MARLWWDGDDELIDATCNHNLTKGFLPEAPNNTAVELGALENPRHGEWRRVL